MLGSAFAKYQIRTSRMPGARAAKYRSAERATNSETARPLFTSSLAHFARRHEQDEDFGTGAKHIALTTRSFFFSCFGAKSCAPRDAFIVLFVSWSEEGVPRALTTKAVSTGLPRAPAA